MHMYMQLITVLMIYSYGALRQGYIHFMIFFFDMCHIRYA